jgi:stalled ribosome rescue protein Dom34
LSSRCCSKIAPRGFDPLSENTEPLKNEELTENENSDLCASLCKPLQKDTKNATVNPAKNLVFDFEKERAIKEIVILLRERETHFCIGLAEIIKRRLLERIVETGK